MWILHWFPDGLVSMIAHIIMIAGVVIYGFSKVARWIPTICRYMLIFELLGFILIGVGSYVYGGYSVEQEWRQKVADLEKELAVAEQKSKNTNTIIEKEIIERVQVVKDKSEGVRREIIEKKEIINKECTLDDFVLQVYNRSLTDPFEEPKKKK